jgi:WD40 repeat protein
MSLVRRWKWIVLVGLALIVGPGKANAAFEQLVWAPDGKTIAYSGWDREGRPFVAIQDVESGKKKVTFPVPKEPTCLTYAPDGKTLVLGVSDGTMRTHDAATGEEMRRWKGHAKSVGFLSFTSDGKSLVSVEGWSNPVSPIPSGTPPTDQRSDGRVCVWDPATGTELRQFLVGKKGEVGWNGLPVDSGSGEQTKRVFLIGNRLLVPSLKMGKVEKSTPEAGTISTWSMVLRVWDITTGNEMHSVELSNSQVPGSRLSLPLLAFAPDGKTMAGCMGSDPRGISVGPGGLLAGRTGMGEITIWETATGKEIRRVNMNSNGSPCTGLFLPDGQKVVWKTYGASLLIPAQFQARDVATGQEIRMIDTATGKEVAHPYWNFTSMSFAPDGKTLVTHDMMIPVEKRKLKFSPVRAERELSDDAIQKYWNDLSGDDAALAFQAIAALASAPRAVPLIEKKIASMFQKEDHHLLSQRLTMALEYSGGPEARTLLKKLTEQYARRPLGEEARASLSRLER